MTIKRFALDKKAAAMFPETKGTWVRHDAHEKEVKRLVKLLERALDVVPEYIDGRNDRLIDAIQKVVYGTESTTEPES